MSNKNEFIQKIEETTFFSSDEKVLIITSFYSGLLDELQKQKILDYIEKYNLKLSTLII